MAFPETSTFPCARALTSPADSVRLTGVKFLPTFRPVALLSMMLSLVACSTPANRRELYNTADANGPWHDYERRLDAAEETGAAPGDMGHAAEASLPAGNNTGATTIVRSRATPLPKSAPVTPDATVLPSNQPQPAPAPGSVPAPASVPASPTTSDPGAPAAPGSATTAPPTDPTAVPVNPPGT
jgi:hypothetical protein